MSVIVCGPPRSIPAWRHVGHCPLCGRGRRLVTRYDGVYYGTTTYCCACNGREQDGDWQPAGTQYAAENRQYITGLWSTGADGKTFRSAIAQFERGYWEAE